jgi:hypothetical protein
MGIGPIVNLASGFVQSLISGAVKGSSNTTATSGTSASGSTQDTNQLSPLAQILGSLQQLQQSNPAQYQQVTLQISNNLQAGAQSATASGNTGLASELTQLSTDFKNASTSGQLPNVQDLAQAIGGGGGRHHRHHHGGGGAAASTSSDASSSLTSNTTASDTSSTQTGLSQFIQSLSTSQGGSGANSPLSIIYNTLSSAGIPIG